MMSRAAMRRSANVCTSQGLHDACNRQSIYIFKGSQTAAYCRQHAENINVDARCRRCFYGTCAKQPRYRVERLSCDWLGCQLLFCMCARVPGDALTFQVFEQRPKPGQGGQVSVGYGYTLCAYTKGSRRTQIHPVSLEEVTCTLCVALTYV